MHGACGLSSWLAEHLLSLRQRLTVITIVGLAWTDSAKYRWHGRRYQRPHKINSNEEIPGGSLTRFTKKASDAKFTSDNFENDTEKIVGSSKAFQTISDLIANASEISIGGLPQPVTGHYINYAWSEKTSRL